LYSSFPSRAISRNTALCNGDDFLRQRMQVGV
jgi:hypothetical protein